MQKEGNHAHRHTCTPVSELRFLGENAGVFKLVIITSDSEQDAIDACLLKLHSLLLSVLQCTVGKQI